MRVLTHALIMVENDELFQNLLKKSNLQTWLKMDSFKKNWFTETGPLWPGQAMSLEIEKILYQGKVSVLQIAI